MAYVDTVNIELRIMPPYKNTTKSFHCVLIGQGEIPEN